MGIRWDRGSGVQHAIRPRAISLAKLQIARLTPVTRTLRVLPRPPAGIFNFPFEVEHVIPVSHKGIDEHSNLALARFAREFGGDGRTNAKLSSRRANGNSVNRAPPQRS